MTLPKRTRCIGDPHCYEIGYDRESDRADAEHARAEGLQAEINEARECLVAEYVSALELGCLDIEELAAEQPLAYWVEQARGHHRAHHIEDRPVAKRMARKAFDAVQRAEAAERQCAELRELLRIVEWGDDGACLICDAVNGDPHEPDCRLAAALKGGE